MDNLPPNVFTETNDVTREPSKAKQPFANQLRSKITTNLLLYHCMIKLYVESKCSEIKILNLKLMNLYECFHAIE